MQPKCDLAVSGPIPEHVVELQHRSLQMFGFIYEVQYEALCTGVMDCQLVCWPGHKIRRY